MAFVIEEKKNKVNLLRLTGWIVVIGILLAAIYYIFFVAPPLLVVVPPANGLQNITPISQATLQPLDVLNSPSFQALKPPSFALPTPQGPAAVGRVNPFVTP